MTIVICVLVLILCVTALAFFFGPDDERLLAALAVFQITFGLAITVGIAFVVIHFVTKYW